MPRRCWGVASAARARRYSKPARSVGTEHVADDFVFLQQHGDGLGLIDAGLRLVGLGILPQGVFEVLGDADIIHHQARRLVAEDPIDPRNRLHQAVPSHRLVDIHRVHARRIESGQPHIAHDHKLQRVVGVLGAFGQQLAAGFRPLADMRLPGRRIGSLASHHHLDAPASSSSLCHAGRSFTMAS